ncbi:hypothetical protein Tco_1258661, partial [Tanacetum coccineum]
VDPHRFEGIYKDGHGGTWLQLAHKIHSRMLILDLHFPDFRYSDVVRLS